MFGLSFEKLIVIGVIAIMIVGPTRLPAYAAKLAQFVKMLTEMANNAKDRVQHELGPEFEDLDWKKLDPRQYDPRRIIREALLDDSGVSTALVRPSASSDDSVADAAEPDPDENSRATELETASSPEELAPTSPDAQLEAATVTAHSPGTSSDTI